MRMRNRRLLWRLYLSYLVITLAALLGVGWLGATTVERFYLSQVSSDLERRAEAIAAHIHEPLQIQQRATFEAVLRELDTATNTRLTVAMPAGLVIADSRNAADSLENMRDGAEFQRAIRSGEPSYSTHYSASMQHRETTLALPVMRSDELIAVVQATTSIEFVDEALGTIGERILLSGLGIATLAAVVGLLVSRQITRPLEEMRHGAERFARGELGYKLPIPVSEELAGLAKSLNAMAEQLQERISFIVRQNNEQRAILTSMVEGVIAVDNEQRVFSLNKASSNLLDIDSVQAQGHTLQEVVRNADLRRFVTRALTSAEPIFDDVVLHADRQVVLQARGAALHDAQGKSIGAVIVLHDVTDFRRLDTIRKDFVANVSHELKTPIASIKGFVETLLDGAMQHPEEAERFLQIVARQADRMNAIIEDLLSLSKIEQGEDTGSIVLEPASVVDVLLAATNDCQKLASEKQIRISMSCDEQIEAKLNAPLLEQAVSNLLDNAIKYSDPGSEIQLIGSATHGEVTISVADRGPGIAADHLPRIFERFYRVDKARSRKLGGTGLGLAIVKHIVQAHQGRVTVRSTVGAGTTFTIYLPAMNGRPS
jgi:two-component system, OmpR family, phosphate regulon sensor histidine kinase PhoR